MPSQTFFNLPAEKQAKVKNALLSEFSTYSLNLAQVARIIKTANISRGAFYKYFTDITDAYLYLYQEVVKSVHQDLPKPQLALQNHQQYIKQLNNFIHQTTNSEYYQFVKLHLTKNENQLPTTNSTYLHCSFAWALKTLSHQTLAECFQNPENTGMILKRFSLVIEKLTKIYAEGSPCF